MRFTRLLALLFALALVAAACSDDTSDTTTAETTPPATEAPTTEPPATEPPATEAPMDDFPPEAGPLGGVLVGAGEAVQIRTLQSISGATEFLGVDQNRGTELAIEDYGQVL
ncbi:MAG: hypothetical protein OEM22_02965, partial [Acidimicrobiia bacterium]|nr:hypothetical protein [Acidimicrobiia bacterium]